MQHIAKHVAAGDWIAQGAQITEGAMTGTSVTLTIKEASAWVPIANALLEDETANFSSYILTQLAQAVAYRLDWACFAADGTNDSTDGAYTGIAVGGTAAGAATGHNTIAKLTIADFVKALVTVSAGVLQRSPKWWIHPQVLAGMLNILDTNGRPLFQPSTDAPGTGVVGRILGYPVVPTAAMPLTDGACQVVAVFGDPEGAAVGIRKQFNLAKSTDFQFDYNRSAFRMVVRAGFVIKSATSFAMLTTAA
jgi:HK97 family phage major capsid protein